MRELELSYEKRLHILNLFFLENICLREDMTSHSLNENCIIRRKLFNLMSLKKKRGHTVMLDEKHLKLELFKGFFTIRVVRMWNSFPQLVVSAGSLDKFKKPLDVFVSEHNV